MIYGKIENFGPSQWLKFPNYFPNRSWLWKKIGWISIPIGLSNYGLCGGLASTALDIFYSGRFPPARTTPPSSKEDPVLFNWLKKRQVESITLRDFWKYIKLLFTNPSHDNWEIQEACEQIKADILQGRPVLIGLQRAKVETWYKVYQVGRFVDNHQVVIWAFEEKNDELIFYLYDPSDPRRADARLRLNLTSKTLIETFPSDLGPVYAFFKTGYTPKIPPMEIGIL